MCLIFISIQSHPIYKLIVAANRDEFYARETAGAHAWKDHPQIFGGRDMEAGGTWMGLNRETGKISMVTNYRDPFHINGNALSRGHLVSDYLIDEEQPEDYLKKVQTKSALYNGFNLLVGNPDELYYYSNYKDSIEKIPPGIHGLSNHILNTPWPKVTRGLDKMKAISADSEISPGLLLDLLYDEMLANDKDLPETGVGYEREKILSSIFIKSPDYGTRCSTVILVDNFGKIQFTERVYDPTTFNYETNETTFTWKA